MIFSTANRYTPIRRFSEKWRKKQDLLAQVRREKVQKLGRTCQIQSPVCTKYEQGLHHLRKQSQCGGHTHENTVLACRACNRWVERNPAKALELGWVRRSTEAKP